MKLKWLLCFTALMLVLQGCSKKNDDVFKRNISTGINESFSINNVFQNNMVIQRDKPILIWGNATIGQQVNVAVSWNNNRFNAVADSSGYWQVSIPATPANSSPQTITCSTRNRVSIVLKNILIGDVWICSGQSNMVMPVDSIYPFRGVTNYQQEIAAANYPMIRMLTVQEDEQLYAVDSLSYRATWNVCSPQSVGPVSAVSYYFARKLQTTLNVPIGIIVSAVNGTTCQQWADPYVFQNNDNLASYYVNPTSSNLYDGMISPFVKMAIKGFTWYQGENNQTDNPVSNYTLLNAALVQGWRVAFSQGDLPFYYVQMTPFALDYYTTTPIGGNPQVDTYAKFREAQTNILGITTNAGMAITMDVGEADNHHPINKKPVGERLALIALNNTYNLSVDYRGPQYSSYIQNGSTITINYLAGTAVGLNTINGNALNQYFFVAGADHAFYRATAVINNNSMILNVPSNVSTVLAVRYAFTDAPVTNLQNAAGLPAEPFRTDNWDN